jgi:predicted transcriptional regulator
MKKSAICSREILDAVSDDKSWRILNFIAGDRKLKNDEVMNQLGITHKEYYSRTSKFVAMGLIRRIEGRYFLTSFGLVIYELYSILQEVIERKLRAGLTDSVISLSTK